MHFQLSVFLSPQTIARWQILQLTNLGAIRLGAGPCQEPLLSYKIFGITKLFRGLPKEVGNIEGYLVINVPVLPLSVSSWHFDFI